MKEITLIIRPIGDGSEYEIHSPSHPHIRMVVQRPAQPAAWTNQACLIHNLLEAQQAMSRVWPFV